MKKNKPDEMEMYINFKAARLSYIFVTLSLLIWMIFDFVYTGDLPIIQFIIIMIQNIIFFGSKLYMTNKMAGGTDEESY